MEAEQRLLKKLPMLQSSRVFALSQVLPVETSPDSQGKELREFPSRKGRVTTGTVLLNRSLLSKVIGVLSLLGEAICLHSSPPLTFWSHSVMGSNKKTLTNVTTQGHRPTKRRKKIVRLQNASLRQILPLPTEPQYSLRALQLKELQDLDFY